MEERETTHEQPKKFTLDKLVPLDGNSEKVRSIKSKLHAFAEAGVEWPIEMMGGGQTNFSKGTFEIFYPVGDIFASYAVTIHELGHLRQGEIDERFSSEVLGGPEPKEQDWDYHLESERDAYERGMRRVRDYAPKILEKLEIKFQMFKTQGKLQGFRNFDDFYRHMVRVSLRGSELHDSIGYGDAETEEDIKSKTSHLAELLKNDPITREFFTKQENWRVGELINRDEIEDVVRMVSSKIAEEKY